jgi:hypothetical protein
MGVSARLELSPLGFKGTVAILLISQEKERAMNHEGGVRIPLEHSIISFNYS